VSGPCGQPSPTSPFSQVLPRPFLIDSSPVEIHCILLHRRHPYLTTLFTTARIFTRSIEVLTARPVTLTSVLACFDCGPCPFAQQHTATPHHQHTRFHHGTHSVARPPVTYAAGPDTRLHRQLRAVFTAQVDQSSRPTRHSPSPRTQTKQPTGPTRRHPHGLVEAKGDSARLQLYPLTAILARIITPTPCASLHAPRTTRLRVRTARTYTRSSISLNHGTGTSNLSRIRSATCALVKQQPHGASSFVAPLSH
jgi:hypothetical protein